ncbi:MAG: ankyrin repeat domain-containing protein [Pseudomonadota bacterium]
MYHILLSFMLIASQNQIRQAEKYLEQQKNHPKKIIQTTKNDAKIDLIAELTKQKELEDDAFKPDLESLGLDQIDNSKPVQNVDKQKNKTPENLIATENLPDVAIKADDSSKKDSSQKIKSSISEILPISSTKTKAVKADEQKVQTAQKEKIKTQGADLSVKKITEKSDASKEVKISAIAAKPLDKIKGLIDKKSEEIKPEQVIIDQEKIEKRKANQVALVELKQKQKSKKLEDLRQKYLSKNEDNDVYEGINRYQTISKIVPREKIPPKFMNSEVPPPLLNRFRGEENKHHPVIMSNSEKVNFMFKAIAENKIDEFNSLYSLVKDPNIKNSFGDTLLTFAVLMRRHDAVASLLSKGADPDLANDLGYTPLNIAIEMVDYQSASTLVDMGAKVNLIDDLGRTYLMQSCRVGSLQITDLLISRGVDINLTDRNGTTALAIAYKHKKDIIAKYLLKYGAKSWVKKGYEDNDTSMIEDLFNKWK